MKPEDRKAQILMSAAACFTAQGFHRTTMDDISRHAGISPGLIYRYFKGKDELIGALTNYFQEQSRAQFSGAMDFATITEALDFLFRASLQGTDWSSTVTLQSEIAAEAFRNPTIAAYLREDNQFYCRFFAGLIRQAQDRDQINRDLPPEPAAYLLMAFTNGFLFQLAQDQAWDRLNDPTYIKLFKQVFSNFLQIKPITSQ